jgi:hypothetical protein
MGIVYKPEPMPPESASHAEKMAWYQRERARAVKALSGQRDVIESSWLFVFAGLAAAALLFIATR